MLVELGNHNALPGAVDDRPKVTTVFIPEFDDGSTHDDAVYSVGAKEVRVADLKDRRIPADAKLLTAGIRLGGYTHAPGLDVDDFVEHVQHAILHRERIFNLPEHEALLAITQEAWRHHAAPHRNLAFVGAPRTGDESLVPAWVRVTSDPRIGDDKTARDVEEFLRTYYRLPDGAVAPADDELEARYWTVRGEPGVGFAERPPDVRNLLTNDGRVIANQNDGGFIVGQTGQLTAATATSATTTLTAPSANCWAGCRVYATVSATQMVFGIITANTNGANSVLTVDRWYTPSTPGGSAGSTPSATGTFVIADGGPTSAWFIAMTTTNITPAATDHALTGQYNAAGGGYNVKISPYAQTSGVAPRSLTLTPVYTGNGSDTYPQTFYAIGVGVSMVVPFPTGTMKYETSLSASATVNASGDQVTVTETISGS